MRKLTHNEIIELRACKYMDNPRQELYTRLERFYADDPEALKEFKELQELAKEVEFLPNTDDTNSKVSQAYSQSNHVYFERMRDMLLSLGYTPEAAEEDEGKRRSVWELVGEVLNNYDKTLKDKGPGWSTMGNRK
ncbi:MAG: hypothetical protein PUA70_09695 [Oribacterium sp.]|nr:hypothetical protein [Oribacterium sp.]